MIDSTPRLREQLLQRPTSATPVGLLPAQPSSSCVKTLYSGADCRDRLRHSNLWLRATNRAEPLEEPHLNATPLATAAVQYEAFTSEQASDDIPYSLEDTRVRLFIVDVLHAAQ
ncbi:hypothetical protein WJX74_010246 [Apatococcus lobatus]|uniref:Uncharacterized protein n=1 Tax=Apatococcus lobatus TaxID=904363 RepID=A0AAW1S5M3_9CHLO